MERTPMRRVKRTVTTLLALVTLLAAGMAGCGVAGSGPESGGDSGSNGTTASGQATSQQTRAVKHALGTTEVPADPKRVVTLGTTSLDAAASLGVDPVGTLRTSVGSGVLDYLKDDVGDVQIVGTLTEPNLEAIAAAKPDLILSNAVRHEDLYDELSGIAPTVMVEKIGTPWKENLRLFARALGKADKAEKLLADYEQRAQQVAEKVGNPGDTKVSILRFLPGEIRIYQQGSYIGTILSDVGLGRPSSQDGDGLRKVISPERIKAADGDVIFVTTWGPKKKTQVNSVTGSKLWQRLDAVQSGNVHFVPDTYWIVGLGIGSANEVLDDLEKYLA